jgi:hypothetical protein
MSPSWFTFTTVFFLQKTYSVFGVSPLNCPAIQLLCSFMSSLSLASYLRVSCTCARVSLFMVLFLFAHTPFVWWSNAIMPSSLLHHISVTVCLLDIVIRPCCQCFRFRLMRPQFSVAASLSWSGVFRLYCFLSSCPLPETVMSVDLLTMLEYGY